ncbi:DUF2634 domain-containing protein [Bacillus altitudinis]|uniref:DUF2634 domain-containing protein n=1 Tax=Bacillus altitudinis TaxID=293387 RepID=UPI001071EF4B|nr:DUF2634 domain-containing protein [Bacillus altitudinis]QEO61607.1 DUF2634 domain-containing protein [Bacillus altitudinis]
MKTLKLVNGDFIFKDGELEMIDGDEEIAQAVELILKTRLGEFKLDEFLGVERENLLGKNLDEEEAQYDIIEAIAQEERIATVEDIEFQFDRKTRTSRIKLKLIKEEDGQELELGGVDVVE